MTDGGTTIKDVLLLLQKDEYGFIDDSLCMFTNLDIEKAWQQAFSSYLKEGKGNLFLFSKQMSQAGSLARMDPLFFCERTDLFFSPLCPVCGSPLEQCEDDGLLTLIGLKPYTRSLKRYLFCEACSNQDRLRFYSYETDGTEPGGVENRFGLIKRFGSLLHFAEEIADFPCRACQFQGECYGTEQKVVSSIVPFAFYPFYMLILSAPTLITWNREEKEERDDLLAAREHALRVGWSLLTSIDKDLKNRQPSTTDVEEKREMLQEDGREDVIPADMSPSSTLSAVQPGEISKDGVFGESVTDDEVSKLLSEIKKDWQHRLGESPSTPLAEPPMEDDMDIEESVETVFLSLSDLEQITPPSPPKNENMTLQAVPQSPGRAELSEAEKTVILSAAPAQTESDFEKTVILNVGQTPQTCVAPATAGTQAIENRMPETAQQVEMDKTVIINANLDEAGSGFGGPGGVAGSSATEPIQDEKLSKKQPVGEDEGDPMDATVILKVDDRPKTRGGR